MMKVRSVSSWLILVYVSLFIILLSCNSEAGLITYQMDLDGSQEVGPGDGDGMATGTISFNDITGMVSWDLTYADISSPLAMHIHGPGGFAGINAGVFIGLGVNTSGGANTLIDSLIMNLGDMSLITSNPTAFYINIHTEEFAPGAVRGQLGNVIVPTPGTLILLLIAGLLLLQRRFSVNQNTFRAK